MTTKTVPREIETKTDDDLHTLALAPVTAPIRSDREYDFVVERIDYLLSLNPRDGSYEDHMIELLSLLVQAYDNEHENWARKKRSPQSIVKFMAEQKGLTRGKLAEIMGGRSRITDFFKSKKPLSRTQILALRDALGIPADLLIGG